MDVLSSKTNWMTAFEVTLVPTDGNGSQWTVVQPWSRHVYRVGLIEYYLLNALRQPQSLQSAFRYMELQVLPGLNAQDFKSAVNRLVEAKLIISNDTEAIATAHAQVRAGWWSRLLFLQIRGFNPDGILSWLAPRTSFLFSAGAVRVWIAFALATALLVLLDFERFSEQWSSFVWHITLRDGIALFAIFVATRLIHELGHGIVAKRFGVRVPDIGIFLILGAPCAYCDVSESAALPRRQWRAAIAAAGMYAEWIVASIAAWVWLLSREGDVNAVAFGIMLVCSASTLLINSNPLMRFDGYYLLSDWLNEPNLRTSADRQLLIRISRLLHLKSVDGKLTQDWYWLFYTTYSLLSRVYRVLIGLSIAAMIAYLFAQQELQLVGRIASGVLLSVWFYASVADIVRGIWKGTDRVMGRAKLIAASTFVLAMVLMIPFPRRHFATGYIEPSQFTAIYAQEAGIVVEVLAGNQQLVSAGQELLILNSRELQAELMQAEQAVELSSLQKTYDAFVQASGIDDQKESLDQSLQSAETRKADLQQRANRLRIQSPADGMLYFASVRRKSPEISQWNQVSRKWGDQSDQNPTIATGTCLGGVCSSECQIWVPLTSDDLPLIRTGISAKASFVRGSQPPITTHVVDVVHRSANSMWESTLFGSQANVRSGFYAVLPLSEVADATSIEPGSELRVVFHLPATSVWHQVVRWGRENFRLDLR